MKILIYSCILFAIVISKDCPCYVITPSVINGGLQTTKIRCLTTFENCEIPIRLIDNGLKYIPEKLIPFSKLYTRSVELIENYVSYINYSQIYNNEKYCNNIDDLSEYYYLGKETNNKIQYNLREIYDNFQQLNPTYLSMITDKNYFFRGITNFKFNIKSDKQSVIYLSNSITYNIDNDFLTYGSYVINSIIGISGSEKSFFGSSFDYFNYNVFLNESECCFSYIDINQIKDNLNIYSTCNNGSLFISSSKINCNHKVDINLCKDIISKKVNLQQRIIGYEITFNIRSPPFVLDPSLFSLTSIVSPKIIFKYINYGGLCKVYILNSTNNLNTINCQISSTEWNDNKIFTIINNIYLYLDEYMLFSSKCSNLTITCTGSSVEIQFSNIETNITKVFNEFKNDNKIIISFFYLFFTNMWFIMIVLMIFIHLILAITFKKYLMMNYDKVN